MSFFNRLKEGLSKTRKGITERIDQVLVSFGKIDDELFDELEEILITSDVGVETTMSIIEDLKQKVKERKLTDPKLVKVLLKEELIKRLENSVTSYNDILDTGSGKPPKVIVVVGVNGVGKTTSIGKIANLLAQKGK
ncbi:MAG: signal recognition particle receptor subunit alpha, partial [Acetivibrionales bacterium]